MKKHASVGLVVALGALLLSGCLGPKPVLVGDPVVEPPPRGSDQPFKVQATFHNEGPGEGQVEVEANLTNKDTGEFIAKETKQIEMQTGDTVNVLFEITLPPSAKDLDPEKIEVEVDAHYPIQ